MSDKGKVARQQQVGRQAGVRRNSCLFIVGWTCLFIEQWKMFTIGETQPNCDANEPQEDAQGTRQIRRGRLNNKTQCEQRKRTRHQETTEQRQKTTSLRINCPPSPSFARFCESRISSYFYSISLLFTLKSTHPRPPFLENGNSIIWESSQVVHCAPITYIYWNFGVKIELCMH